MRGRLNRLQWVALAAGAIAMGAVVAHPRWICTRPSSGYHLNERALRDVREGRALRDGFPPNVPMAWCRHYDPVYTHAWVFAPPHGYPGKHWRARPDVGWLSLRLGAALLATLLVATGLREGGIMYGLASRWCRRSQ